eukprot:CAMPEP_0198316332 /NCGR_PEP_ID=MMETSP1450-20131203/6268_1 /TAXON_ID=753684 ORGANISM="Madagascaria erythrocladiodes, Strain CCMP3234" /NCGR_SAMPLE_ID=MMETSP1450 /ASSEMBLY_ACC=CAM_ASM_001115 /LENGTH=51 /DNA_ID=CAMNT_0044019483 /DNA_START=19 /DNA_END=170 /DNA_ORIENTATION=+
MKRRPPQVITLLNIGTVLQQSLQAITVALLCSNMDGREAATSASSVRVGTV